MATRLKTVNFPIKDPVVGPDGKLTPIWNNELVNLQLILNELIKAYNTP